MLERSDGLDRRLCLSQQWQPARHIATTLMRTGHLRDEVCPLADQVVEEIGVLALGPRAK
jgi:hypothetical protein